MDIYAEVGKKKKEKQNLLQRCPPPHHPKVFRSHGTLQMDCKRQKMIIVDVKCGNRRDAMTSIVLSVWCLNWGLYIPDPNWLPLPMQCLLSHMPL